jgi:hypothetical protein
LHFFGASLIGAHFFILMDGGRPKMKRIFTPVLIMLLTFILAACGGGETANDGSSDTASSERESEQTTESAETDEAYEITYQNARAYTNSIGTVWTQVIFEVTNTGSKPLYCSSGSYDLEDENGSLIASKTMVSVFPDVISPGEKAYYYEETTIDDFDANTVLVCVPRPDIELAKVDDISFPVTDVTLSAGKYGGIEALGRVENISDQTEKMVYVSVVLYDSEDKPIGLMFTILMDDLEPGAKIGFELGGSSLPDDITMDSVARFECQAYPTQMQF